MKEVGLHQLVPSFILDHLKEGKTSGSFEAAGLFIDTSGFTALTDALMAHGQRGAEVLAEVIHATFGPLMHSAFEQGGFVTSQEGDAFTALFPLQPGEDAGIWRALSAAVQAQQRASGLVRHVTVFGEFATQVKIGLGVGEVFWSIIPSEDGKRATYYFRGSAIDNCAKAQQQASSSEIWMDAGFYARAQQGVSAAVEGEFSRLVRLERALEPAGPLQAAEVDLELAGRFYPRELFTWSGTGEFRHVAYLFVSLPTIRTDAQLGIFMQTLYRLQDRYGGLLSRVGFGDKGPHLLFFWGAPVAHENDVQRALNFILELQAQTAIPINGGITYRIAHAGFIGSDLAEDYAAFGRGPNLAARFMTSAPRGEIWVDEYAAQRAGQGFILEYAGEHSFKGFALPQKVYQLVERGEEAEILPQRALVGREAELAGMDEFIQPLFSGKPVGILAIWGEPGVGKSSLAYEFLRRQEEKASPIGLSVFLGQSDEILRQPLNPFRYWLRRYFQVSDAQGESRNKRSFNRKVDELIGATREPHLADELDRTRSFLGALLDLYWPDSLYEQLDAKGRYENTFLALAALLQAESRQQPVIFLLEDAHWLDEESKVFLPRLLRILESAEPAYPIAILITARLEEASLSLEGLPNRQISLDRLNRAALSGLAVGFLEGEVTERLLDLLEERAEGNPFFTEQILQYLKDENLLSLGAEGWDVKSYREIVLPADVGSLLVARLDRLAREVKQVVQTAAVLGREFEVNLLDAMLQGVSTLPEKIAQAEAEGIWNALSEIRYLFKHVLLRDAAYQMQIHTRRQELHRLAFEAFQRVYADRLKDHYGELAYHAEQAGMQEEALEYLELAGNAAMETYQNRQAEDYYTRALALIPGDEPVWRFRLLTERVAAYKPQGKNDERQRDLVELENLVSAWDDPVKKAEIFLLNASYHLDMGQPTEAISSAQKAVDLAIAAGDTKKAIDAYWFMARGSWRLSEYESAIAQARKGLELAESIHSLLEESRLLSVIGMSQLEQENLDLARSTFEKSLEKAREIGHLTAQAVPLNNLGNFNGQKGNFEDARLYYERSLEIARKTGDLPNQGLVLMNLGWIAGNLGEYGKASAYIEQNLRIARDVGDPNSQTYGLINLSAYASARADYQNAEVYALQGRDLARTIGDRSGEAWAFTYLGHAWMGAGRVGEAAGVYRTALDIRRELRQPVLACEPLAGLVQCALARDEVGAALPFVEEILKQVDLGSLEGTDEPLRVYLACYRALSVVDDPRAAGILEKGHRFLLARSENIRDENLRRMFMENVPAHREMLAAWRETQDQRNRAI